MNVIITGSRDWPKRQFEPLWDLLDGLYWNATVGHLTVELSEFHLYAGDCPTGIDTLVKQWAEVSPMHSYNEHKDDPLFAFHEFKADWDKYGKAAGPVRNATMLNAAKSGLVVAFFSSTAHYVSGKGGTRHCRNLAKQLGTFRVYDVIGRF